MNAVSLSLKLSLLSLSLSLSLYLSLFENGFLKLQSKLFSL